MAGNMLDAAAMEEAAEDAALAATLPKSSQSMPVARAQSRSGRKSAPPRSTPTESRAPAPELTRLWTGAASHGGTQTGLGSCAERMSSSGAADSVALPSGTSTEPHNDGMSPAQASGVATAAVDEPVTTCASARSPVSPARHCAAVASVAQVGAAIVQAHVEGVSKDDRDCTPSCELEHDDSVGKAAVFSVDGKVAWPALVPQIACFRDVRALAGL